MLVRDIFETQIEEKIDPVVKVAERQNEQKLASEIGAYVVTPILERYFDDFLEHYTDTFLLQTGEIGVWISGYFGSGKSYLAKMLALLAENPVLNGVSASKRFDARVPAQSLRRDSILRSIARLNQCDSQILAFNINSLTDSKNTPLPRLLLSQFYQSKGYGANLLYARVIEAELDKLGKLEELHRAAEKAARKSWADIQNNPTFYARALYEAACMVAPEIFQSPEEVAQALKNAEQGDLYNDQFLVRAILNDLSRREQTIGTPCRFVFVLDETGQWIEDDAGRLYQLQALIEEAAIQGQGKIWFFVTTHADMGTIYQNARALRADMKKIEDRFRLKFSLTTENIEKVLEDRLFCKTLAGKTQVIEAYDENPGVLRDLGELKNTGQKLPECSQERFTTFYPFFPYQIHLIPEIVKSLRSAGGRGEQLSGSTRTLLAITQDILRAGRRDYLDDSVGVLVSFDEVFGNLAGEGEVSPDVRREISRIEQVVHGATTLTRRLAEVLYLVHEINYIPRTIDNICRLLVEETSDDLPTTINRIQPELDRLVRARLVAKIGEEYEFLTGERRTFEEEVAEEMAGLKVQDLESGLAKFANINVIGFSTISYYNNEFPAKIWFDSTLVSKDGSIDIRVYSPFEAMRLKVSDLEDISLRPDEQQNIFVLCDRVVNFDDHLKYYLAMQRVINRWKGDPHKSDQAHKLAADRESHDLDKLRRKVQDDIQEGLRHAQVVFRGAGRAVFPKAGQSPNEAVRNELATYWPTLYPKYDKVPVRVINEQRAIQEVLAGHHNQSPDIQNLRLFDRMGQIDIHAPVLDAIRAYLTMRQDRNERTLGRDMLSHFTEPPFGWDPGCVRVGVAALVRSGMAKILIEKRAYTNPADSQLQDALRVSRNFDRVEVVLEETELDPDLLIEVRKQLITLTKARKMDETPAALSTAFEDYAKDIIQKAERAATWAEPAQLPLPVMFQEGREAFQDILALTSPLHRVKEIHRLQDHLPEYAVAILSVSSFVERWGRSFGEMRDFVRLVQPVAYRLPEKGSCAVFLQNWDTAFQSTTLTDTQVWKDLQNARAAAGLELEQTMNRWRKEACEIVEEMLNQLKHVHLVSETSGELTQEDLVKQLEVFLSSLEKESDVSVLATASDRARRMITRFRQAQDEARRKKAGEAGDYQTDEKPKPIERIRLTEITHTFRIKTEEQWNEMRERLDQSVKDALANGSEVEII